MVKMGAEGVARRSVVRIADWSILKPRMRVYQDTAAAQSGTETATWLSMWLKGLDAVEGWGSISGKGSVGKGGPMGWVRTEPMAVLCDECVSWVGSAVLGAVARVC